MSSFLAIVPQGHNCEGVLDCIKKALQTSLRPGQSPEFKKEDRGVIIRGIDEAQLRSLSGIPGVYTVQYAT